MNNLQMMNGQITDKELHKIAKRIPAANIEFANDLQDTAAKKVNELINELRAATTDREERERIVNFERPSQWVLDRQAAKSDLLINNARGFFWRWWYADQVLDNLIEKIEQIENLKNYMDVQERAYHVLGLIASAEIISGKKETEQAEERAKKAKDEKITAEAETEKIQLSLEDKEKELLAQTTLCNELTTENNDLKKQLDQFTLLNGKLTRKEQKHRTQIQELQQSEDKKTRQLETAIHELASVKLKLVEETRELNATILKGEKKVIRYSIMQSSLQGELNNAREKLNLLEQQNNS